MAQRIEPDESSERVGEHGGCEEDVPEVCEAGELRKSRLFLRIGVGRERKSWVSEGNLAWARGERGKDGLSGLEVGEASRVLPFSTSTTKI